eukprot:scaffold5538_cov159-Amphora_coffeaeformis.AAC.10
MCLRPRPCHLKASWPFVVESVQCVDETRGGTGAGQMARNGTALSCDNRTIKLSPLSYTTGTKRTTRKRLGSLLSIPNSTLDFRHQLLALHPLTESNC